MSTKPIAKKKRKTKSSKKYIPDPVKKSDISTAQFYILKWIACITMAIDHIAHFFQEQWRIPGSTYLGMRYIGRIAFPLFAYLMTESFRYTENRKKHLFRIGILALLSELPFDVVFLTENGIISLEHQNVCVTLFLGFLCLMVIDKSKNAFVKLYEKHDLKKLGNVVEAAFKITVVGVFALTAELMHADFGLPAIVFIAMVNFSRGRKHSSVLLALAFLVFGAIKMEMAYLMIIIPFALICLFEYFHNKSKGRKNDDNGPVSRLVCSKFSKRFTGIFYPLHLVVLIVIRLVDSW